MKGKQKSPGVGEALSGEPSKVMRAPDVERIRERTKAIDKAGKVIESKLKDNQRKLGVDAEHRTPQMKKGKRGTYP